jgi:hypothetical protein
MCIWPHGLDLCPQSQITQQPTDNNGYDNNKEGEEEEEEEEEMGASDKGVANALTKTMFNPAAGRIIYSVRINNDNNDRCSMHS